MMLLWMSSGVFEEFEDPPGEVPLQASTDFAGCFAFGEASRGVGLRLVVTHESGQHDGVERAVELTVSTSVESVSSGLAR